jgi:8-oxo-dGTP diphosphatase
MRFVYAVAFDGDKFVMVRNKQRGWEMPGGKIGPGESPQEAVEREFLEETGMGFDSIASAHLPNGTVFFGFVKGKSGKPAPRDVNSSEEICSISLFDRLPEGLSFPRKEYESMLQEAKIALKK